MRGLTRRLGEVRRFPSLPFRAIPSSRQGQASQRAGRLQSKGIAVAKRSHFGKTRQIAEIANRLIDPILAKRAGINTLLLASWDEIAGEQFAGCSRPERIRWPRQDGPDETGGGFSPGVLTIACEGARALFLMHQEAEVIARVNSFFGFRAVSQIRIVQKAVHVPTRKLASRPLDATEKHRLAGMLAEVEDPRLRQSLERLGAGVMSRRPKRQP